MEVVLLHGMANFYSDAQMQNISSELAFLSVTTQTCFAPMFLKSCQ
jgi:hypothetical protein